MNEAYDRLKRPLSLRYPAVDIGALERLPVSHRYRRTFAEDLAAAGVDGDVELLSVAEEVRQARLPSTAYQITQPIRSCLVFWRGRGQRDRARVARRSRS